MLDTLLFHNECKQICLILLDFEMSVILTKNKCFKISIILLLKIKFHFISILPSNLLTLCASFSSHYTSKCNYDNSQLI